MSSRAGKRPSSYRPPRRGAVGPAALAAPVGALAGLALAAGAVAWRAVAGAPAEGWIGLAAPAASALAAGACAAWILRALRVASRDVTLGCVAGAAAPAWLAAQLARLLDPAAALAAGGGGPGAAVASALGGAGWPGAAVGLGELPGAAPGLAPVAALSGAVLWVLLACELALVAGALCAVVDRALSAPLCVACQRWCRRSRGVARLAAAAPDRLVIGRAQARDWRFFRELGPPRGHGTLRIDLAACHRCDRTSALTLAHERPLRRDRVLVLDLRLGPDDLRTVQQLGEDVRAPLAALHGGLSRPATGPVR